MFSLSLFSAFLRKKLFECEELTHSLPPSRVYVVVCLSGSL